MFTTISSYGTEVQFSGVANLNSLANAAAKPLGKVDSTGRSVVPYKVEIKATLASSGVSATGTIAVYLIEAVRDTTSTYTDTIDPAGSSDVASSIKNARVVRTLNANANNQVVQDSFTLPVSATPKFWSLVILNSSGAALAASGNDAYFMPDAFTTS